MRSGPRLRPATVPVETSDVPHGPRAYVRHTAKSTISDHFDPLTKSFLQLRHTTLGPHGSPLDVQSFHIRAPPQPSLSP